jgi:hypothetical protein
MLGRDESTMKIVAGAASHLGKSLNKRGHQNASDEAIPLAHGFDRRICARQRVTRDDEFVGSGE